MPQSRFRILHIEDDDIHARLVRRSLAAEGVEVDVDRARDGAEALEYVRAIGSRSGPPAPDLILLDLKLPKVDGQEVLCAVKADEALRLIPVVVLTTSDEEADRRRAYREHANSYLVKPVSFDQFQQLVCAIKSYWATCNRPGPAPA